MKKVKFREDNVYYKPRKNGNTYYYRVYSQGKVKTYRIGSDRDTVALLKANYDKQKKDEINQTLLEMIS